MVANVNQHIFAKAFALPEMERTISNEDGNHFPTETLENDQQNENASSTVYEIATCISEMLTLDNIIACMRNMLSAVEYGSPMFAGTMVQRFMECPPDECAEDEPTDDYPFPTSENYHDQMPDFDCGGAISEEPPTYTENGEGNNSSANKGRIELQPHRKRSGVNRSGYFANRRPLFEICDDWEDLPLPLIGLIFAPFVLLLGYLFYDWYKARRTYLRKRAELRKSNNQTQELNDEVEKLEAYSLSFDMYQLVLNEERMKAQQVFSKKTDNIKELCRQCKTLKEERSILREVLRRINCPEADKDP